MDTGRVSWWHTLPGVVTAIAGAITAIAGLLLTLHQIGLIGDRDDPDPAATSVSSGSLAAPEPSATTSPAATRSSGAARPGEYAVEFPSGKEASLRSITSDATYTIINARVENRNTGMLTLAITVRMLNTGRYPLNFWNELFRLVIDGAPRAPTGSLNELLEARSAKDGEITFDVPASAESLVLLIDNGENRAELPVVLKKSR